MRIIFVITILCVATACRTKSSYFNIQGQKFDNKVIEQLPIYDSLSHLLIENYSAIRPHFQEGNSFEYIWYRHGNELYKILPQEPGTKVKQWFKQLGDSLIFGFALYKDSSVKIFVRDTYLDAYKLNVRERLSFNPKGATIKNREFKTRDTLLNKNWEYWIWFDDQVDIF
jgi:hypothetical protein